MHITGLGCKKIYLCYLHTVGVLTTQHSSILLTISLQVELHDERYQILYFNLCSISQKQPFSEIILQTETFSLSDKDKQTFVTVTTWSKAAKSAEYVTVQNMEVRAIASMHFFMLFQLSRLSKTLSTT